jgi:PAS domain S-box-containing protein
MQNEELILAKEKAVIDAQKYSNLYDFAPSGYITVSKEGEIVQLNIYAAKLLGKSRTKLINNRFGFFVSDDTKLIFNSFLDKVFESNATETCELTLTIEDKNPIYIYLSGISSKSRKECFINLVNISERRHSEEKFHQLSQAVEQGPVMVIITNTSGLIEYVNPKFTETTGYTFEEIKGKNPRIFKSGYTTQMEYKTLWDTVKSGNVWSGEFYNQKKDKTYYWESVSISPIKNIQGEITHFIAIKEDVTKRKKSEQELVVANKELAYQNQEKEKRAIELVIANRELAFQNEEKEKRADELFVANKELAYQNEEKEKRAEELIIANRELAFQNEEKEKRADELFIANKELAYQNKEKEKRAEELIIANRELAFQNEEKEKRADELFIANKELAFQNNEKEKRAEELIIANRELAYQNEEKEKRAEELVIAKQNAEESDRLKTAFLANMSHEIRTPMNGILGFTELLKKPQLEVEEQQEYIEIIEKSGVRMLNVLNNIMSISKVESGQVELHLSDENINNQIINIHNFFKREAKQKGIEFKITNQLILDEALIKTDHEKVNAILSNLVKNAITFTKSGAVEISLQIKEGYLEFFIKDSGIGISDLEQKIIFERFRKANETLIHNYGGSGLGLAISKAYVELLGGEIWVESEQGKGSTFYFKIPYLISEENFKETVTIKPTERSENELNKLKILIVEDDAISKLLVTFAVKKFAKEILHVTTGLEAVKACLNNPDIDLVMMDINMPEMDGYEATRKIRAFNKDIFIITQTANGMQSDRDQALAAGSNDYISKPINLNNLNSIIKTNFN